MLAEAQANDMTIKGKIPHPVALVAPPQLQNCWDPGPQLGSSTRLSKVGRKLLVSGGFPILLLKIWYR